MDPKCPKREAFNRQANTTRKGRSGIRKSEWRLTATKSNQRTGKSSCTSSSLARSASLKETPEVSQDGTYTSAARKATISHMPSNTITPCQGEIDQALEELALEETQAKRGYASQKQISELQKSFETVKSQFSNQAKERKERRLVWQRREEQLRKERDHIEAHDRLQPRSPDSTTPLCLSENTARKLNCVDSVSSPTKEGSVHSTIHLEQFLAAMQSQKQLTIQQLMEQQQHQCSNSCSRYLIGCHSSLQPLKRSLNEPKHRPQQHLYLYSGFNHYVKMS